MTTILYTVVVLYIKKGNRYSLKVVLLCSINGLKYCACLETNSLDTLSSSPQSPLQTRNPGLTSSKQIPGNSNITHFWKQRLTWFHSATVCQNHSCYDSKTFFQHLIMKVKTLKKKKKTHYSDGRESPANAGDPGLVPGLVSSPWRRTWQPTPVFLPRKIHGQRSLAGCSLGWRRVRHNWTTNTSTFIHLMHTLLKESLQLP